MKATNKTSQANFPQKSALKKNVSLTWLIILFSILFGGRANAQVTVTGSTGANATYSTLGAAFTAINGQTNQSGNNIVITITASTTETATASLKGQASNSWTTLKIYPTTTGLSISGNLAAPLIDLYGADNVTIDGRVNATGSTKDLTITNTSILNTAGTSTIRFINYATNNTIKYCTIKGSEMVVSNGTTTGSGVIFFSTATSVGNNDNTIDNNNITNAADASRPLNAIYSLGTNAKTNSGNTISNNCIYDFLNRETASNGIYLGRNTSAWTISGNSFYETTSFVPTAASAYNVIYIVNTSGINFNI